MRISTGVWLVAMASLGCRSAPATPRPPQPTPIAPRPLSPSVAPRPIPDAVKRVLARGGVHLAPIAIDGGERERWLVGLGTPQALHALFIVAPGAKKVAQHDEAEETPVDVPRATRVVRVVTRGGRAWVWLESLEIGKQPKGLHTALLVEPKDYATVDPRLVGLESADAMDGALEAPEPPDAEAIRARASKAAATTEGVVEIADPGGVLVLESRQKSLLAKKAVIAPSELTTSTWLPAIKTALEKAYFCGVGNCETSLFVASKTGPKLRAIVVPYEEPFVPTTTPKLVAASDAGDDARAALRRVGEDGYSVLATAPLSSDGGTLAVLSHASTPAEPDTLLVAHALYTALLPIDRTSFHGVEDLQSYELRFADVDGDGWTDVVLRLESKTEFVLNTVSRTPQDLGATEAPTDLASRIPLMSAKSVDAAAAAAIAIPARGLTTGEACAVIGGARKSFSAFAAPGAKILEYEEPGAPTYFPKIVKPTKSVSSKMMPTCDDKELRCEPGRPYCWSSFEAAERFWFTWIGGAPKLAGVAFYVGT